MSSLNQTTDGNFTKDVLQSNIPVVVDFWAEWCGPCRMIAPVLEEVAKDMEGKIKILKLNIEESPTTPAQFGVRSIPTLTLFKNGQAVSTMSGVKPKSKIIEWVNASL